MEENTIVTEEPVELKTVETEVGEVVEGTPETITPVDPAEVQEVSSEDAEVAVETEETTEEDE